MFDRCVGRVRPVRSCLALLCVVGSVSGAANAQNVRCVVITGRQAHGTPAGAVFTALELPTVGDAGNVVFRATLGVGAGGVTAANDVGIWRYSVDSKGAGEIITRKGNSAPIIPGATLVELGLPVADAGIGAIGYWTRLAGNGITPENDRAVFVRDGATDNLWYQAGSPFYGTVVGEIASLDDYRDRPVLNGGGLPAFTGVLESGLGGVFTIDRKGESIAVALEGAPVPDFPAGLLFGSEFSPSVRDNVGDVAFRASLERGIGGVDATNDQVILIYMAADGAYFRVARTGGSAGHHPDILFDSLSDPMVSDEPRVGFRAGFRHGSGGIDDTNDSAICSLCPCGSVNIDAQRGQPAGSSLSGVVFDSFSLPLYGRNSRLLFGTRLRGAGVNPSNDSAIFWANLPFEFVMVAREGAAAPGAGTATFADFEIDAPQFWLGATEESQLVFSGTLSTGQRGLWVFTPNRGTRLLVLEGQNVQVGAGDTRQIISIVPSEEGYFTQGRRAQIGADRRVTFLASVTGGDTGVFVADLPPVTIGCPSDWDNSGVVNSQDFFMFLTDFFGGVSDINNSGATDSQDFFDFLAAFFAGC